MKSLICLALSNVTGASLFSLCKFYFSSLNSVEFGYVVGEVMTISSFLRIQSSNREENNGERGFYFH